MWKTPCCKALVDDRGETGWKSFSDYEVIDKSRVCPNDPSPWRGQVDVYGMWRG